MKAGLSAIHQTLTPESSAVVSRSVAEAARRSHGQTTPLHVAAALLSSPSGHLRHACLRSHPTGTTTTHPLHTRALDLCFSVALDRLPTVSTADPHPPLSNALSAALKRAQAHQRRGCSDQSQQPPLLAVRVELDQLIVSILDDPSVSRVMREAGFSSVAVKSTVQPSLNAYINPRLAGGDPEHVSRVLHVMSRTKKRNPILVGDADPNSIMREVRQRSELQAQIVPFERKLAKCDRSQIPSKIRELGFLIESRSRGVGGLVFDMGDLKWLVDSPEIGRSSSSSAVAEMASLLARLEERGSRVWLVGTATCTTYLRCQVYHPSLESDWDLQALPITPPARLGGNGILSSSVESLSPMRRRESSILCSLCNESCNRELAEQSSSDSHALPHWLRVGAAGDSREQLQNKDQEIKDKLMKKWREICSCLHRINPMQASVSVIRVNHATSTTDRPRSPPGSPVKTDLVLRQPAVNIKHLSEPEITRQNHIKHLNGSIHRTGLMDSGSIKKLYKGLADKVNWQTDAAAAVAAAVVQCSEKPLKWLLFAGPDVVGKRKMANALSELVFATQSVTINLGGLSSDASLRGMTALDRIADTVRRSPFSVIVLEDIDQADGVLLSSIKSTIERDRVIDSNGREIGLGSAIFVLTDSSQEQRILNSASLALQLELSVEERSNKRRAEPLFKLEQPKKPSCPLGPSLDLNLAIGGDDDSGSWNSSDITVDHDHEEWRLATEHSAVAGELVDSVDRTIMFKPVDFSELRKRISDSISSKFRDVMGNAQSIKIDAEVLDQLVAGVWFREAGNGFEEWSERVLVPSIIELSSNFKVGNGDVVRLSSVIGADSSSTTVPVDWLPSTVAITGA